MTKYPNTLTIINRDANRFAMRVSVCGELHLSTVEIRDLLELLRKSDVASNFVVDFGKGHIASASSVLYGRMEQEVVKSALRDISHKGAQPTPGLVPAASVADTETAEEFWNKLGA